MRPRDEPSPVRRADGSRHWNTNIVFDEAFYDYTMGTCPHGHQYLVDD